MKRILLLICLLMSLVTGTFAESLTAESVMFTEAATADLVIGLNNKNKTQWIAYQMVLTLPKGVEVAQDGQGHYLSQLSSRQDNSYSLSIRKQDTGRYAIVCYSAQGKALSGRSGELMTLTLVANDSLRGRELKATVSDILFSEKTGEETALDDVTFDISVIAPLVVTANSYSREYGDDNPSFGFTAEGQVLVGTPVIGCSAKKTSPVGDYPIVIKKGTVSNYNDSYVNGTLTITKAPLTITVNSVGKKQGDAMPEFTITYSGFKNGESKSVLTTQPIVTCEATAASPNGSYPIIVSGATAQNYDITFVNGTLTVNDADPVVMTANSYTIAYGDELPTYAYTSIGATVEGTPSITCEATTTSPVGVYPIVITKGTVTNYNDSYVNGTLTITKAPLTISVGSESKKQGDAMPEFKVTYSGFKNNETNAVLTAQPAVTCEATAASPKGSYPITISGAAAQNYDITFVNGTLTVNDADAVAVTANSYSRAYGDENPTFDYTSEGATLVGKPDIFCEATITSAVGDYPIVITKGTVTNYNDSYTNGTLTITKAPLTITVESETKKQGEAMPEFKVTYSGFKNGEDKSVLTTPLTVSCEATAASPKGTYPITLSGAAAQNYDITFVNGTLTVNDADAVAITANSYTIVYGEDLPTYGFTTTGATLEGTPTISCEATASSPAGTYPIIITKGTVANYNDSYVNGTLTIKKAPLTITVNSAGKKQGDEMPEFTVTYSGFQKGEDKSVLTTLPTVTCEATAASPNGTYPITLSGAIAQNYVITYVNGVLTVNDADPVVMTAKSYTIAYGDELPTYEFTSEGAVLEGVPTISCEATASSPAGTYPIVIAKGTVANFNDSYINGTLTITKVPLTITVKSASKKQGEAMPEFTLTYDGFKNNETNAVLTTQPTITCEATATSPKGTYPITVSGAIAQNYDITYVNSELTVDDADPVTVTAKSYSRVYGEANPTYEYSVEGATLEGTPAITCEANITSPVGTYPIVITKGTVANFNDSYINGTLTITKAPLTIEVLSEHKKQGEAMPEFTVTYTGLKNNETNAVLTTQPTVTCEATAASPKGTYPITVSGAIAQNYDITYVNSELTVDDADPLEITANSYTIAYGDDIPVLGYTAKGLTVEGAPTISCEATSTSPVGTYSIVISKGTVSNYNVSYIYGTLTITKAPLTITANSESKKQGEAMPTFSVSYSGFKNGETSAVLTTQPTIACEATDVSAPGEYAVTVSGAEAKNYDITFVNGLLTVKDADPVTLTAKSYTRVYGEANPTYEFTSEGATLEGTPTIACEATATSPVGTYPIVIKKGTVSNYNDHYVNGTLTITPAPLTIKAGTYSKKQGEENPDFELTYEGFKNGETEAVLTQKPNVTTTATVSSMPGSYPVSLSGAKAQNYTITYVNGTLLVFEADRVLVVANDCTREYGEPNPTFEFASDGATLEGTPTLTCLATETSPVGTYDIFTSRGSITNSNVTLVNGTLTVTKAPLTITVKSATKKEGEANPTFEVTYSGFKNGETEVVLTKKPTITCSVTANSPKGTYPITLSGAEAQNYDITYVNGTLTVTSANILPITAESYIREYGEENPDFDYFTNATNLGGTPTLTCEATAKSPVGTYPIIITKGSVTNPDVNYVNGTLTITKAPLKVSVKNCTRYVGEGNPTFELIYSGFKNEETEAVLTKKPVATCTATDESGAGTYTITISGGEATNYTLSYEDGTMTVEVPPTDIFVTDNMTFQVSGQAATKGVTFVKGPEAAEAVVPESTTYNGAVCPVVAVADGAFANRPQLKSVKIPASIKTVGKDLFANSSHLAAIIWEASFKMTKEMAGTIADNPNLLFYTTNLANALDGITNIVNKQTKSAEKIVLTDVGDVNDFYCPEEFKAAEITYTHEYKLFTEAGKCEGWESLALPFDVTEISHETKGVITPFGALQRGREYENGTKPFWLYEYTTGGRFEEAERIRANVPYIISMPNEAKLWKDYVLTGRVSFKGTNATVKVSSAAKVVKSGNRTFAPNFQTGLDESVYLLNTNDKYDGNPKGSVFVQSYLLERQAHPFEAYFEVENSAGVKGYFSVFDQMTDEIRSIAPVMHDGDVEYYQLDGTKHNKLQRGFNIIRTTDGKIQKMLVR